MMRKRTIWLLSLVLLISAFLAAACDSAGVKVNTPQLNTSSQKETNPAEPLPTEKEANDSQERLVKLYFSDQQMLNLIPESRKVKTGENFYHEVLEELLRGPDNKELCRTIPEGTKLLSFKLEGKTATVNFDHNLRDRHWGGSTAELFTVYSIVDTLTQFPEIEKVSFLLDGEKIDSLVEHVDLTEPLAKDETMIKE
ncbi:MAG: GerMN domain-containing protein [bacterium]